MPEYLLYGLVVIAQIISISIFVLIIRHARRKSHDQASTLNDVELAAPREDGPLSMTPIATFSGIVGVPWWVSVAKNNSDPELVLSQHSMRYSVQCHRSRAYEDLACVDVRTAWGTASVIFRFKGSPWTFSANMGHPERVARVLKALPATVPFTRRASVLLTSQNLAI